MLKTISIHTPAAESLVNITAQVRQAVIESEVSEGICVLYTPHTTAAVTVNSGLDKNTAQDILAEVHRLVPTRVDFNHQYDTPADASGHIKTTLVGTSQCLIVTGGELLLGSSQSVFLYEFDGPRTRQVLVRIMAEG